MKLKALLVDDEINILRNLQLVLQWESNNVEIVGFAKNGVQALELVKEHQPHLIFCDIRMPIMDGIEFLQRLREFDKDVEVIMLTGYQDFEYARSVLRYRVVDYVLKPIDYEMLEKLFENVISNIRNKWLNDQKTTEEQGRVKDIAYEKVLLDLINGFQDEADVVEWNRTFLLSDHQYLCFVLECVTDEGHIPSAEDMLYKLYQDIRLQYSDGVTPYVIQVEKGFWTLILQGSFSQISEKKMMNVMQTWRKHLIDYGLSNFTIGAFDGSVSATDLQQTWDTICKEISFTNQPCLLVKKSKLMQNGNLHGVWNATEALITAIKHRDHPVALSSLDEIVMQLKLLTEESVHQVEKLAHSVLIYLIKELRKYDAVSAQHEAYMWSKLSTARKTKELVKLVRELVEESFAQYANKRPQVSIHIAAEYIESHLSNDLAADEVANYLNISSTYFSTIFKQHYGVTFIEYVTQARIERAKLMLTKSKKSISDIAKAVGYTERRYFNKVFQKRVGILPSEYREENTMRNEVS